MSAGAPEWPGVPVPELASLIGAGHHDPPPPPPPPPPEKPPPPPPPEKTPPRKRLDPLPPEAAEWFAIQVLVIVANWCMGAK